MFHYRFKHSTRWFDIDAPPDLVLHAGFLHPVDFVCMVQSRHNLKKVVLETHRDCKWLRPHSYVVVRHVPLHWRPPPRGSTIVHQTVPPPPPRMQENLDALFGPDPYATVVTTVTKKQCIVLKEEEEEEEECFDALKDENFVYAVLGLQRVN